MNHNIFIVQAGNSQVANNACRGLVEPNADAMKSIIAHSETIGPGQKTTIEFETPPVATNTSVPSGVTPKPCEVG